MIFIGKLTATAQSGVNNHTTAVPFDIPDEATEMYFESDTDDVLFGIGAGTGDLHDTFAVTEDTGSPLYASRTAYVVEGVYPVPRLGRTGFRVAPAWAAGTLYAVGDMVTSNGQLYSCSVAGTSDTYGPGPSPGSVSGDGTVSWIWRGASEGIDKPNKTVKRVAIYNPTVGTANVRVWVT